MATTLKAQVADDHFLAHAGADIDRAILAIPPHQLRAPDHNLDAVDPAVSIDPYTHFGDLRARCGDVVAFRDGRFGDVKAYNVFGHDAERPIFGVLGYNAIRKMALDKVAFQNGGAYGQHTKAQKTATVTTVNELDGEAHSLTRKVFDHEVFSRDRLVTFTENTIGPVAKHLAQRIRARLNDGASVDLSRDFSLPLIYIAMARIVGVPIEDISYFVEVSERAFGGSRDYAAAMAAVAELTDFFTRRLAERRRSGDLTGDDLMSVMAVAELNGRRFDDEEIVVYCRFLLPGGIETTWRQTANLCLTMMTHPDQFEAIRADPSLSPAAIEECLRWLSSGFVLPRIAAQDTEVAGVHIPAGSSMVGIFGVANRDPRIWDDADRFDIFRKRIPHLTFSVGSHACMGQRLARQNFEHALRTLVEDLPDLTLACDPGDLRTTGFQIRCPDAVPVRSDGRSLG